MDAILLKADTEQAMKLRFTIAALLVCAGLGVAHADIIYLNTGGVLKGKIVKSDDSEITVQTKHGETTISRDDIGKIEACESVAQLYYDKLDKLEQGKAEPHFKLGQWLKRINEPALARDEYEKAIIINPDHAGARAQLGYIKKGGKWVKKDAKPKTPKVIVKRGKKKPKEPADEHNLLSGASEETKKLINKLASAVKSEREEALKKLAELFRWGDVRAVQAYMRYREAKLIITLQQHEGEILNLLHGQLDQDLRDRQLRWFNRYNKATTMRERRHACKTLGMLLKGELAGLKKMTAENAANALDKRTDLITFLKETQAWLKDKNEFTTEFGTCLTDTYRAVLWARAGKEKRSARYAAKLDSFDKYLVRIILSWHLEEKSARAAKEMLTDINSLRETEKLGKLKMNAIASKAALGHARDMFVNQFFSHTSPTFGTPDYRLQRQFSLKVNWKTSTEGELISKRSSVAAVAFNEWARDKSVRETLLSKEWKSVGIANLGSYWVVILLRK
jgi:uncharacterized protein YkwD